jgi:hypothetical protein
VPGDNKKAGRYPLARQVLLSWCGARSGGGQDPQSSCPGNRLRPAVGAELAVDVAGVGLDRVQREEKPGSDFWIGQPFGTVMVPLMVLAWDVGRVKTSAPCCQLQRFVRFCRYVPQ